MVGHPDIGWKRRSGKCDQVSSRRTFDPATPERITGKSSRLPNECTRRNVSNLSLAPAEGLFLNSTEEVDYFDVERLRDQLQTGERDIHFAALECSDLSSMKSALVGKYVLGPTFLPSKIT